MIEGGYYCLYCGRAVVTDGTPVEACDECEEREGLSRRRRPARRT